MTDSNGAISREAWQEFILSQLLATGDDEDDDDMDYQPAQSELDDEDEDNSDDEFHGMRSVLYNGTSNTNRPAE
jgi:hypothetical protein